MSEKPDDCYVVPLHRDEHRKQHTMDEQAYWRQVGIDPLRIATGLYIHSGNEERAELIIKQARGREND